MKVPAAWSTSRLESLPKGLKEMAESIINKKAGVPEVSVGTATLDYVSYSRIEKVFSVYSTCNDCGYRITSRRVNLEMVSSYSYHAQVKLKASCRCGVVYCNVTPEHFIRALEQSEMYWD